MFMRFTAIFKPMISKAVLVVGMLAAVGAFAIPQPASADTRSTAEIVAAAAMIVGAIAYDQGRPYYVRDGRRRYVSPAVAGWYQDHHRFDGRGFGRHRR